MVSQSAEQQQGNSLASNSFSKATPFVSADAQEAAEIRARQQQQASQIFKVQQKQYEPAHLAKLDEYIVRSIVFGGAVSGGCCCAPALKYSLAVGGSV